MKLVYYTENIGESGFDYFRESLRDKALEKFASDFIAAGLLAPAEIPSAIERAKKICRAAGYPVQSHFKALNVCKEGKVYVDWRLSATAAKLVLLNANPDNPVVAELQMRFVRGKY